METGELDNEPGRLAPGTQGGEPPADNRSDRPDRGSSSASDIDLERLLYDPEYRQSVRGALKPDR